MFNTAANLSLRETLQPDWRSAGSATRAANNSICKYWDNVDKTSHTVWSRHITDQTIIEIREAYYHLCFIFYKLFYSFWIDFFFSIISAFEPLKSGIFPSGPIPRSEAAYTLSVNGYCREWWVAAKGTISRIRSLITGAISRIPPLITWNSLTHSVAHFKAPSHTFGRSLQGTISHTRSLIIGNFITHSAAHHGESSHALGRSFKETIFRTRSFITGNYLAHLANHNREPSHRRSLRARNQLSN